MAKTEVKTKACKLRIEGNSIKDIAKILNVSKSSVSIWCRNLRLSKEQLEKILSAKYNLIKKGRMKGARLQHLKRVSAIKIAKEEARKLRKLKNNEFFIAGLALYLAEGTKTYGTVQFTNSDKRVIHFMIKWFNRYFDILKSDMKFSIHINQIHQSRERTVVGFWKNYLKLKPENLSKIRYVKTVVKKKYKNHDEYYGTLDFRIKKSTSLLYKLNALTDRLLNSGL